MSLRSRMLLWFGGSLGLLIALFGVGLGSDVHDAVVPLTRDLASEIVKARSAEVGRLIQGYQREVRAIAASDLFRGADLDAIEAALIRRADDLNPDFEILFFTDARGDYVTTRGARGNTSDRDYWKAVFEQGQEEAVSNPLLSRSTGQPMFVVASVVRNDRGERVGLAAATVLLTRMSQIAEGIHLGESGAGWIVDGTGLVVAHPDRRLPLHLNLMSGRSHGYEGLEEIGARVRAAVPGEGAFRRPDGTQVSTLFSPIPNSPGWTFGISYDASDWMDRPAQVLWRLGGLVVMMLLTLLLVVAGLARRITAPIHALQKSVACVSAGDLDHRLDIRTGDEIQVLADAFDRMTGDLKARIADLQRVTAEKERVESDLRVARRIQAGMLPRVFPPFLDLERLDLFATMEPAREVGGDFFDFLLLDDRRLYFCIGDVSGKGVPAALFMVIAMTLLRNQAMHHPTLEEVFHRANDLLCADNEESMFATVFLGILDLDTGALEFVNAGHPPPLVSVGGGFRRLDVTPGLPLGVMAYHRYRSGRTVLRPGDVLFLYTDGVTEAMDGGLEAFGEERAVRALDDLRGRPVRGIIRGMREAIDGFSRGAPASDDVAMMAVSLAGLPARRGTAPGAGGA